MASAFATKWVPESSEREDKILEEKEKRGIPWAFFRAATLAFMHMRLFAGKKGHSLNASVKKHALVGMFPNSKLQWTWTQ